MIADFTLIPRKEVIRYAPSSYDKELAHELKPNRIPCREEKIKGTSNPVQFNQEAKHGKPNEKLTGRNEADMPEQLILQQIIKSPQKPIQTGIDEANQGASPLTCFGMYLGSLRRKKGLSIRDLAGACSISIELAAQIELGEASLLDVAECLPKVSEALGENVAKLSRLMVGVILD